MKIFRKNIGEKDRTLRFIIASILLIAAFFAKSWLLLAAAVFVFFEAFMSWCVFYQLIGKNSCKIKKK